MMDKLKLAEAEIKRFQERVATYRECQTKKFRGNYRHEYEPGNPIAVRSEKIEETLHQSHGCPCSAAIKRASMDVTRALVELRR